MVKVSRSSVPVGYRQGVLVGIGHAILAHVLPVDFYSVHRPLGNHVLLLWRGGKDQLAAAPNLCGLAGFQRQSFSVAGYSQASVCLRLIAHGVRDGCGKDRSDIMRFRHIG